MESISVYGILALLAAINVIAFILIGYDKRKSIVGNTERMPEGQIFFLASMFGAFGVYAGMQLFRHKTRKWYFQVGIPLLIFQNMTTLYALRELIV